MTTPDDPFRPSGPSSYGPPPTAAGRPGPTHPGPGQYGPGQPGRAQYGPGGGETKTDTKAIVALVLAVAAWTPTVPFLGAIAALFVARSARRDIEASGGRLTGLNLCTWATVLSWVHLVVVIGAVLVALVAFGLFAVAVPFGSG